MLLLRRSAQFLNIVFNIWNINSCLRSIRVVYIDKVCGYEFKTNLLFRRKYLCNKKNFA